MSRSYRSCWPILGCFLAVTLFAGGAVFALGEFTCGNRPLNAANYTKWAGIINVINNSHRVYHSWVNGNEDSWFSGTTDDINSAMDEYWRSELESYQIILLPNPGPIATCDSVKVKCNWRLHVMGGITAAYFKREKDSSNVYDLNPTLYVYVDDASQLKSLRFPSGALLLSPADIRERCLKGVKEGSNTTRGYAASLLASIDSHTPESARIIAGLLDAKDANLSAMAIYSLSQFGANAQGQLETLQKHKPENDNNSKQLAELLKSIKEAKPRAEADQKTRELVAQIDKFVARKRQ